MQIDGYLAHGSRDETDEFHMFLSLDVDQFLGEEARGANRMHVKKVAATLENIRRNGLQGMTNNTLFVREGKFSSGQPGMGDIAVYAVKSNQLRVYGGIVRRRGKSVFLCPEGAIKKKDKADRAQLERVAKILGKYNDR